MATDIDAPIEDEYEPYEDPDDLGQYEDPDDAEQYEDFEPLDFGHGSGGTATTHATEDPPEVAPARRRGGGPPGGSAFDENGQVRRIMAQLVDEKLRRNPPPDPRRVAFEPLAEAETDPALDTRPGDADEPVTPVGPVVRAPNIPDDPRVPRSFPGGKVRLPRLDDDPEERSPVTFVGTAFVRQASPKGAERGASTAFEEYFTYESLFDPETEARAEPALDDAYQILGVTPETSWREVVAVHRRLVKDHHPDRLVDASQAEVELAERQVRRINAAFEELRQLRKRLEAAGATEA